MTVMLLNGDALHIPLADESVQCCITSPPYWGLRDYGLKPMIWGGDSTCLHDWDERRWYTENSAAASDGSAEAFSKAGPDNAARLKAACWRLDATCRVCGAWRGSLGLEPTPDLYIEHLVAVFREVWRVLRADGVCFINLGDTYWHGGAVAHRDVRDDGNAGIALQGSPDFDSSCCDLCDECAAVLSCSTWNSDLPPDTTALLRGPTGHDSGHPDCASSSPPASPRGVWASTSHESSPQLQAECSHCSKCGACLDVLRSASPYSLACVRTGWHLCRGGKSPRGIVGDISGMDASGMAWLNYTTLKPKDLCMIPARVALALQADGWWLRSDIIWNKSNPMPSSVTDRPTSSYEHVFLLTKSQRYFYDAQAIAEPSKLLGGQAAVFNRDHEGVLVLGQSARQHRRRTAGKNNALDHPNTPDPRKKQDALGNNTYTGFNDRYDHDLPTRNKRDVWTVATQPYRGAHFAVMPEKLVEPMVLAGSSPKACEHCGAPWERVTESTRTFESGSGKSGKPISGKNGPAPLQGGGETGDIRRGPVVHTTTTGWRPTCACTEIKIEPRTRPSIVLDIFSGTATVGVVSIRHGRQFVGLELNPEYIALARDRLAVVQPLLTWAEVRPSVPQEATPL